MPRRRQLEGEKNTGTALEGQVKRLKDRVASLYNSGTPTVELKRNLRRSYASRASFEDPLVTVPSLRLLWLQFAMLRVLLHSFWSLENHALFDEARQTLLIDHTVYYRLVWFLPAMCIRTFTLLTLEKRGKVQMMPRIDQDRNVDEEEEESEDDWVVVAQQEHWSFRSFIESMPVVGFLYRTAKWTFGIVSSVIFTLFFPKLSLLD